MQICAVYLGYIFSYLLLLTNLVCFHPIGIFVAIVFILFSRHLLKPFRRLTSSGIPLDDE